MYCRSQHKFQHQKVKIEIMNFCLFSFCSNFNYTYSTLGIVASSVSFMIHEAF